MSCDSQTLKQAVCQTLLQFAKACYFLGLGATAYHSRKGIFSSFNNNNNNNNNDDDDDDDDNNLFLVHYIKISLLLQCTTIKEYDINKSKFDKSR